MHRATSAPTATSAGGTSGGATARTTGGTTATTTAQFKKLLIVPSPLAMRIPSFRGTTPRQIEGVATSTRTPCGEKRVVEKPECVGKFPPPRRKATHSHRTSSPHGDFSSSRRKDAAFARESFTRAGKKINTRAKENLAARAQIGLYPLLRRRLSPAGLSLATHLVATETLPQSWGRSGAGEGARGTHRRAWHARTHTHTHSLLIGHRRRAPGRGGGERLRGGVLSLLLRRRPLDDADGV